MGIKGWLTVGGALLTGIAVWLGLKKKEDEHYEKIQKMIRDVDRKEPKKKEEETTEKIIDDIEKSFRDMGLGEEADAYVAASEAIQDTISKEMGVSKEELIEFGRSELDKVKGLTGDELIKKQEEFEQQKAQAEADYKRKVKKAVEQKNWTRLEDLFDEKYAGGPWHPSPASVFGQACDNGDISEDILQMAEEHFGKLWNYSGD